jgi:hypothetical protein
MNVNSCNPEIAEELVAIPEEVVVVVVAAIFERGLDAEVNEPSSRKIDSKVKLIIRTLVVRPRIRTLPDSWQPPA